MTSPAPFNTPVLGNPTYNVESTIKYLRDVTVVVISQVALYRDLCPNTEFKEVEILGHKTQILKPRPNNVVAKYLMKYMNGSFEMLNHRHLKSLTMMIKNKNRTHILESYTIGYKYDSESPELSYSTNTSGSGATYPIDYIHDSTLDMLMRVKSVLTDIVKVPLPDKSVLEFKLYSCDSSPVDFLPTGYRFQTDEEAEQEDLFLQTPLKFRTGRIKSNFGSMTFHTRFIKGVLPTGVSTQENQNFFLL